MPVRILSNSDSKGDHRREKAICADPQGLFLREHLPGAVRVRTQPGGDGRPSFHGLAHIHRLRAR